MKVIDYLRRSLFFCFANPLPTNPKSKKAKVSSAAAASTSSSSATIKNRLSTSFADLFKDRQEESPQEDDSLIDAVERLPSSPSRSVIVGTIFGHRRGRVAFCVQHNPAVPPPFLFELSIPTQLLVHEMRSGLLRLALECQRSSQRAWKAYYFKSIGEDAAIGEHLIGRNEGLPHRIPHREGELEIVAGVIVALLVKAIGGDLLKGFQMDGGDLLPRLSEARDVREGQLFLPELHHRFCSTIFPTSRPKSLYREVGGRGGEAMGPHDGGAFVDGDRAFFPLKPRLQERFNKFFDRSHCLSHQDFYADGRRIHRPVFSGFSITAL